MNTASLDLQLVGHLGKVKGWDLSEDFTRPVTTTPHVPRSLVQATSREGSTLGFSRVSVFLWFSGGVCLNFLGFALVSLGSECIFLCMPSRSRVCVSLRCFSRQCDACKLFGAGFGRLGPQGS